MFMKKIIVYLISYIFILLIGMSCTGTQRIVYDNCNCNSLNYGAFSYWNSPYLYNRWMYDLGWNSNWWFYNRYPKYYNRNTTPTPPPHNRYDRRRNSTPRTVTPSQPQRRYYNDNVYPERRSTHRVPMTPSLRYSQPSQNTPSRSNQNRSVQPSTNSTTPSRRGRGGVQ